MTARLPDYHIHTTLCNHASGAMEEYVERALALGMDEIGFAEHMPVMPEPHLCMSFDDLPYYIERVNMLKDKYAGLITIRLGAEMDMTLDRYDEIRSIIEHADFDYVIGSIHYLGDFPFDQKQYRHRFEHADLNSLYDRFFNTVAEAAKSGLYDITGHVDNLKRMGFRPSVDLKPYYEMIASILKENNLTIELNTSGYDFPAYECYPSSSFLKVLRHHNVPVTVGSDAHCPEHVGRHFDKAYEVLYDAGYTDIAYFEKRKRFLKSLYTTGSLSSGG